MGRRRQGGRRHAGIAQLLRTPAGAERCPRVATWMPLWRNRASMVKAPIKTVSFQYVVMDDRIRGIWASMEASMITFERAKGGRSAAGKAPRAPSELRVQRALE